MRWIQQNFVALLAVGITVIGTLVAEARIGGSTESRLYVAEQAIKELQPVHDMAITLKLNDSAQGKELEDHKDKLQALQATDSAILQNSAVTQQIMADLNVAIKEFTINTKALTDVVIRLDERVKTLERTREN